MRKIKSVTKAPKGNMKGGWKKGYKAITKFKAIRSKAQLKFQNIIRKRFCHTHPPPPLRATLALQSGNRRSPIN